MGIAVTLGIGLFVGITLAFLLVWGLRESSRRRTRRNLASAFIGEIAAALREIEISNVDSALERLCVEFDDQTVADVPELELPRFTVYETGADKLNWYPSPLPRRIAYVVERLESLPHDLAVLKAKTPSSLEERESEARIIRTELKEVLAMADET
jgi:hypothetical protein